MIENKLATVCAVDDAQSVRESLAAVLKAAALHVEVYASAADFLKVAMHPVGCLVVDKHMVRHDGD